MTGSQAHTWPAKYFAPAVRKVADRRPEAHGDIVGATPYSLRRGMLERNYSFAIEDLEDERPKPAEEERLRARAVALSGTQPPHRLVA